MKRADAVKLVSKIIANGIINPTRIDLIAEKVLRALEDKGMRPKGGWWDDEDDDGPEAA